MSSKVVDLGGMLTFSMIVRSDRLLTKVTGLYAAACTGFKRATVSQGWT